ncbi:MAG TPA: hypothetical protein VII49_10725 [Rhizomicrobium sp.]
MTVKQPDWFEKGLPYLRRPSCPLRPTIWNCHVRLQTVAGASLLASPEVRAGAISLPMSRA